MNDSVNPLLEMSKNARDYVNQNLIFQKLLTNYSNESKHNEVSRVYVAKVMQIIRKPIKKPVSNLEFL